MPQSKRDLPADLARERRQFLIPAGPEVRLADPAQAAVDAAGPAIGFRGHAAVFDKRTWIGPPTWGFAEQVARGAFTKTIGEHDIRMLLEHDPGRLLARNKAAPPTLRLAEDKVGLDVDADMAPTSYGRDAAVLLERGDLSQMSFGFQVVRDSWEEIEGAEGNKFELRTLLEVKLFDVSIVAFPAYEQTDAGLRDLGLALLHRDLDDERRAELETALRDAPKHLGTVIRRVRDSQGATRTALTAAVDQAVEIPPAVVEAAQAAADAEPRDADLPLHEVLLRHTQGAHNQAPPAACPICKSKAATPAA